MTTKIVTRYAENINKNNEIAKFEKYFIEGENISALSWEMPNEPRKKMGEALVKMMAEKISLTEEKQINVILELTPEQPDNAIVKHKKTWGLIESRGIDVSKINNKKSYITPGKKGLVLTGTGKIPISTVGVIQGIINSQDKLYFTNIEADNISQQDGSFGKISDWMKKVWENNGIIFILLGSFDEIHSEIVALGHKENLLFLNDFYFD
ncbi:MULTISPECIES: hypothetical protein [Erwinia]|uniref:hypothetical protein n=1 Tax=Erwinia TaxID=551 RepID=UPI00105FF505|nr:hypothetical protein [Erwinia aphidicola]MCP2231649.1 hypothetical protein [Erwinia aphidicola]